MLYLKNSLKKFKNGLHPDKAKKIKGFDKLLKNNFLIKKTKKEILENIPDGVPRWASKFKFTKRKYGITTELKINELYYISKKGLRFLKDNLKSDEIVDDKLNNIIDESDDEEDYT